MSKFLTGSAYDIDGFSDLDRSEQDAILRFRNVAGNYTDAQKTTLAILLLRKYRREIGNWVRISHAHKRILDMAPITSVIENLSDKSKLTIAIELLESQFHEDSSDEGDGLPDPDEFEEDDDHYGDEDYYAAAIPGLDGVS